MTTNYHIFKCANRIKLNKIYTYLFLGFVTFCSLGVSAQDTLKQVYRPRLGIGTGVMTYYGEVQNYQKNFSPIVNRFGGLVYVNAPVSRMFNLEFTATYAKIAANERTLTTNFNFESQIRMGTVMLYYNFYPLFNENRSRFHPFIGAGFSSFEFLSKTDLFDGQGNRYYYWSDGSIMNMDESDPFASTDAVPLKRDYTYETDLRELNADGIGKYREQSFAFPISIGAEWHMSPRWDFRIATTYNFTFTDLIDNISTAGTGLRAGDKNKDRLLMTYVSLSYDLQFKKAASSDLENLEDEEGTPLFADWDPNDFDKDGIIDAYDQCPWTPIEALVDTAGCPLDSDKDGVPDYYDDEPGTAFGNYVNEFGVTLTEDDFIKHARLYNDSTGYEHEFAEIRTEVILNREQGTFSNRSEKTKSGLTYVIIVGKERKDITVNDLHKFLGYNDYSSIVRGDTVYYTLGQFESIEEAVAAKAGLENNGVEVAEIGRSSGNQETIFSVDEKVVEKVERINIEEGRESPDYSEPEQVYRIQLGAFKNKINTEEVFPGLDVVYGASQKDNINRYYSGSFKTYEEAIAFQKELAKKGFKSTFIVAYEQQKRVTLIEAGVDQTDLPVDYSETSEIETFVEERDTTSIVGIDNTNDLGYDPSKVKYRIQLAYFENEIPIETVDILYNIRRIKPVKGRDGSTTYYSQEYGSEAERTAAMKEFAEYGLADLKVVIEYEGQYYSEAEFAKKFKK